MAKIQRPTLDAEAYGVMAGRRRSRRRRVFGG
jgi:hypothetical protein